MRRGNPYGGEARETREAIVQRGRGREIQLSGPQSESSGGQVGGVTPGGELALYGLVGITPLGAPFRVAKG
jgi:hypothetical protein